MSLLKVSGLTKNFGGLCAVSNVNMEINEKELIGLIGPNGAGKTTLFNLLTLSLIHIYVLENIIKSLKKYNQKGLNAVIILL